MISIGRICIKTAGRDAGGKCVVVDIIDNRFVMIDGETRRRKCNIMHLEPLSALISIKKNASHDDVKNEFEKLGFKVRESKEKPKAEKPATKRVAAVKVKKEEAKPETAAPKGAKKSKKTAVAKKEAVKKPAAKKKEVKK